MIDSAVVVQYPEVLYPVTIMSVPHILFLSVLLPVAVFCASKLAKKYGFTKKIFWVCAFIAMVCETEKILFFVREAAGGFRLPAEHLPFNMCTFQILLIFIVMLSANPQKHKILLSFMFPTMIAGGFMGMFVASAVQDFHGLLDIATYRYFFFHAMVVFLGFYLYFSKPIRYDIKSYLSALFFAYVMLISGIWMNAFFGWYPNANFMFSARPPSEGLPIINLNNGWTGYIFAIMCLGLLLITLCYLPVIIREARDFLKSRKKSV